MRKFDKFAQRTENWTRHSAVWETIADDDRWSAEIGIIKLPEGVVIAETTHYRRTNKHYTTLEFICQGIKYHRTWELWASRRFVVTLAKRFVADVVAS